MIFFGQCYGAKIHGIDELANSKLKSAATLEREEQQALEAIVRQSVEVNAG
ncbi:MAG: hypothetical protein DID90_2727553957 [Candidatus Nitrotoga sp. LAW]|nr:MAG: hypothetical protein DID90_2727553957 [Candidatus Nitrotoga sp. LAW]